MVAYIKKSKMPISAKELFAWHERTGAFERLSLPWESLTLIHKDPSIKTGSELLFKVRKGPFFLSWLARHTEYDPPHSFIDEQIKGPFKKWVHRHRMIPISASKSELEDTVHFETPFGGGQKFALQNIEQMFLYRHTTLLHDLQTQCSFPHPPMTVAITGASGLVGSALTAFLQTAGHRVLPIVRHDVCDTDAIAWDPINDRIEQEKLEGIDAVINLAGENIGSGRWTTAKKKRIRESRIKGTRTLVKALNHLKTAPKTLISASAMGYYGTHPQTLCQERTSPGNDFLASVCVDWEKEANHFTAGRVVNARFGVVLSPKGGALAKMLPPFLMGLGGRVGTGKQWLSWIAIDDLIYTLYRTLVDTTFSGPVNLCAPQPITNAEFTKILGKVLNRPTIFSFPAFVARCLFGEMADATLLSSCQTLPETLLEQKKPHHFYYNNLEKALRHMLGKQIINI